MCWLHIALVVSLTAGALFGDEPVSGKQARPDDSKANAAAKAPSKAAPSKVAPKQAAPDEPEESRIERALSLWKSGEKDKAAGQLLADDDEDPTAGSTSELFLFSEADFLRLDRAGRNRFQQEFIDITPLLRGVGNHCLALADRALAKQDFSTAAQHFDAVNRLGHALSAPEHVLALHGFGKIFIKRSEEGLSRCEKAAKK